MTAPTMTGSAGLSFSVLEGEAAAASALARVGEHPDTLLRAALGALEADHGGRAFPPSPRLRAFMRALQKRIEAA